MSSFHCVCLFSSVFLYIFKFLKHSGAKQHSNQPARCMMCRHIWLWKDAKRKESEHLKQPSHLVILVTPSQHIPTILKYPKHSSESSARCVDHDLPGFGCCVCSLSSSEGSVECVLAPKIRRNFPGLESWASNVPLSCLKHLTVLQLTCSICATCFASFESGQWFNRRDLVQRSSMVNCEA